MSGRPDGSLTRQSRVVAARQQVSCEVAGDVVILNLADEVYYGLDEVGALVWRTIQEPHTVAEVLAAVVAEYDVEPAVAERDLLALLDDLAGRGLVELAPASPSAIRP